MAEIIDIRHRLRDAAGKKDSGASFRIRIGGPDLHWLGIVGGVLAGALREEGVGAVVTDAEGSTSSFPLIEIICGSATTATAPGLLIAGEISPAALRDCDRRTLLLRQQAKAGEDKAPSIAFPGQTVPLPLSDPTPTPLTLAAACIGGAARLIGIGWNALEHALRQELILAEPVGPYLIPAFESYHLLAPWAGAVTATAENPF